MAKSVFIFGAGASQDSGIPTMNEFMEVGLALKNSPSIPDSEKVYFDKIETALTLLSSSLYSKFYINLNNIEDVFGLIEMGRLINKFPGIDSTEDIYMLHEAIVKFIVNSIQGTNLYYHEGGNINSPSGSYSSFSLHLRNKFRRRELDIVLITFNYDIALDFSLFFNNINFDYCLSDSPPTDKFKLIKLHGSINWGVCPKCKNIVPLDFHAYFQNFHGHYNSYWAPDKVPIRVGTNIHQIKHLGACQTNLGNIPLLVPPTWNKTEYHEHLSTVWKHAANELAEAENIFVIGYSMPETDLFFKYLLALGTLNPQKRLKRFWVFNPCDDEHTEQRYENICGQGIKGQQFQFFKKPFIDALSPISEVLGFEID